MRIGIPSFSTKDGWIRVTVSFSLDNVKTPFILWYEIPAKYEEAIFPYGDAFLVALLFLGMRRGEDIYIDIPVSPKLLSNLEAYQYFFAKWFWYLKPVKVYADVYEFFGDSKGVASFFSGGVDSFYTLFKNIPENQERSGFALSHGIFIHGFDSNYEENNIYDEFYKRYSYLFKSLNLDLIPVKTNLKSYINDQTTGWRPAHGAFLLSVALLLQGLIHRVYVPPSLSYNDLTSIKDTIVGSNFITDPLLSTENLEIIYHDPWTTRWDRIQLISSWEVTYDNLFVCFVRDKLVNCCKCEKCIRTMIALELLGKLQLYNTFPKSLTRKSIRKWRMPYFYNTKKYAYELLEAAKKMERRDIVFDLSYMIIKHKFLEVKAVRKIKNVLKYWIINK